MDTPSSKLICAIFIITDLLSPKGLDACVNAWFFRLFLYRMPRGDSSPVFAINIEREFSRFAGLLSTRMPWYSAWDIRPGIGLDSRVKFVILIFPYASSKHPSEGSLNVLRISHDAFGATLLLRMPHLCSSHPSDSQLEQMWQSWSRALQPWWYL